MYYYGKYRAYLLIECDRCGKVIKFDKDNATEKSENNYVTVKPIKCSCGNISNEISSEKPFDVLVKKSNSITSKTAYSIRAGNSCNNIYCPKCGSTQIQLVNRRWSLLTGFLTNKVDRVCMNCKIKF